MPTLASISPNSLTAGDTASTLTVNGTNLNSSSVVRFNGNARTKFKFDERAKAGGYYETTKAERRREVEGNGKA